MKRLSTAFLSTACLLAAIAVMASVSSSWTTPAAARQQFQDVLLRYGTATSPVEALHYTGAAHTFQDHPNRIGCYVAVSTATTIQAVGGSCATPGAGLSIYITDISFSTSAAAGTTADSFPTLKSGTGGTCGTATAVVWGALTTANSTVVANLSQPIKLAAAHELCWIMTTAGSKVVRVNGFIAP